MFIYSRGGNLSESNTVSEIGKHRLEKTFHFFFPGLHTGSVMALTAGARVRTQVSPCQISDG